MQSTRIFECEVCGKKAAKYTCPRCELRTCSLECVKIHKTELECNGIRDKVKFKTLKNLNNMDLLSDYRLLEETARLVNKPVKLPAVSCYNFRNGTLPIDLYRLKCTALKRGIQLRFLPPNFSRRKENTSCLDYETQNLYWRIDWVFVQADNLTLSDEKVLDSTVLSACIHKYIDPENGTLSLMSFYQSAGHSGITLLLKAETTAPNRYFLLDSSSTIQENLCGKAIIEYPVVYVVLTDHTSMFNILSEDEEQTLRRKLFRRTKPQRHLSLGNKNFLFSNINREEGNEEMNPSETDLSNAQKGSDYESFHRKNFSRPRGRYQHFKRNWNRRRGGMQKQE